MPPELDSTVKRLRNPKLAKPRVQLIRGEFSDSAYWLGPTCKRKRPAWPYTQIFGRDARISAMPCTSGGGVSHAVHVPPSACHFRTMLWRRTSSTEIVVESAEAMLAACRIHGSLRISVVKILQTRAAIGCGGERVLHDVRGQQLRQNDRLGRTGFRVVHDIERYPGASEGGQGLGDGWISFGPIALHQRDTLAAENLLHRRVGKGIALIDETS